MLKRVDLISKFKEMPLFKYFKDEAIESLLDYGDVRYYSAEDALTREGDSDESMMIIIQGSADSSVLHNKKEVYLCTVGSGEVVGESGIFHQVCRNTTTIAKNETVVLSLKRDMLFEFIRENPTQGIQLLMMMIYSLDRKLKSLNHELAFERKEDMSQTDIDDFIKNMVNDVNR